MKTIFKNKEGNVTTDNAKIKIPATHTALSVLSQNKVSDGEEFREDFWVYKNNEKIRKWFTSNPLNRSWPPNFAPENAERIEKLYRSTKKRSDDKWTEVWELAQSVKNNGLKNRYGRTVIDVPNVIYGNKERLRFNVSDNGLGISWVSISEPLLNDIVGIKLNKKYTYCETLWSRLYKARQALSFCIENKIKENASLFKNGLEYDTPTCITLNGQQYWVNVKRRDSYVEAIEMVRFGEDVVYL